MSIGLITIEWIAIDKLHPLCSNSLVFFTRSVLMGDWGKTQVCVHCGLLCRQAIFCQESPCSYVFDEKLKHIHSLNRKKNQFFFYLMPSLWKLTTCVSIHKRCMLTRILVPVLSFFLCFFFFFFLFLFFVLFVFFESLERRRQNTSRKRTRRIVIF